MAPHAEEPKPDSGVDLIQHDGKKYGDWRDDFHRDGCAVVKNVITPERAEYYKKKQIEWLQSFGLGFDPNDESTWTADHLPVSFKGGMYFAYSSTHEKFVWEARTESKVLDIFTKLWGTDELISSFDGMNITLPRQKDLTWSPWPHCDQSEHRKGMQCVQGLLNYQPNGPNDGGLILMKGSAKLFDEFFAQKREQDEHEDKPPPEAAMRDLFIFKEEDVKWFQSRGCTLEKMNLEPGDFVSPSPSSRLFTCSKLIVAITGALGQQDNALRSPPTRRPNSTCPVHLHDSRQVCEEGRFRAKGELVQGVARYNTLAALQYSQAGCAVAQRS